jgi:2-keto-4-pentenoate hydratase
MTPALRSELASALREAARTHQFIEPLSTSHPQIDIENAYAIAQLNADQRLSEGRRMVGRKIGLTALAVQKQLGVDQPDYGVLFDDMGYFDGEVIPAALLTQPRIEVEVAFVLGRDLRAPHPGQVELLRAIDYALPAMEIVGSRIRDWAIRITDTIADNASASAFVLGTRPRKLEKLDLRLCGMVLERRGEPVSLGAGAACLGNPLNALLWLARKMVALNTPLRAGDVVLSGALGPMVPVRPGDVFEARINGLGSLRAIFEADSSDASHAR